MQRREKKKDMYIYIERERERERESKIKIERINSFVAYHHDRMLYRSTDQNYKEINMILM